MSACFVMLEPDAALVTAPYAPYTVDCYLGITFSEDEAGADKTIALTSSAKGMLSVAGHA